MCGLAGIVSSEISEEKRHIIVSRMMQFIENRGSDEKIISSYKESTFGFARLSIEKLIMAVSHFYTERNLHSP